MNGVAGFILEESLGQSWLRSTFKGADIRFFLRGPLLDSARGESANSRTVLTPVLGESALLVAPRQIHGTTILDASAKNALPAIVEADGILLDAQDGAGGMVEASLRFADCAPVVVVPSWNEEKWNGEKNSAPWVLMMHSGYKGTVQNIVRAGLDAVRDCYGASALWMASAWVGPCIGKGHYPRDREEWTLRGLNAFHRENARVEGEKVFFDIAGELRLQLEDAGIAENRIVLSGEDTFARRDLCYSYRRGDRECRMFLWAKPYVRRF